VTLLNAPVVLAGALLTGAWYAAGVGTRRLRLVGRTRRPRRLPWRGCAFALALATIVLALDSPLEREAEVTIWAHMTQHILLMMVAAPLLVLGAPWMPCWRVLPLGFRRIAAGAVVKNPRFAWLRWIARAVATPLVAWILFNGTLALWHVPWLYDLTLRNTAVHYAEHAAFLVFGVLFWAQVIDSPPFRSRLSDFGRAVYTLAGAVAPWLLAVVLALAPRPLYPVYTGHHGLSALSDQQVASGVMWGPGSIPYAVVLLYCLYGWLGGEEPRRRHHRVRAAVRPGVR